MRNTCDQLRTELQSLAHQQRISTDSLDDNVNDNARKIQELREAAEQHDEETRRYMRRLEELGEQNQRLADGLAHAYAQCAMFEASLDRTLGVGDESCGRLDDTSGCGGLDRTNLEELLGRQSGYNKVLGKLDECRRQLEDYERERSALLREREELIGMCFGSSVEFRSEVWIVFSRSLGPPGIKP